MTSFYKNIDYYLMNEYYLFLLQIIFSHRKIWNLLNKLNKFDATIPNH